MNLQSRITGHSLTGRASWPSYRMKNAPPSAPRRTALTAGSQCSPGSAAVAPSFRPRVAISWSIIGSPCSRTSLSGSPTRLSRSGWTRGRTGCLPALVVAHRFAGLCTLGIDAVAVSACFWRRIASATDGSCVSRESSTSSRRISQSWLIYFRSSILVRRVDCPLVTCYLPNP